MYVKLASTIFKNNSKYAPSIFFLHGLFGNRLNLYNIARDKYIEKNFNAHLIDARNHGNSGHADTMSYKEMARDIINYANEHNIDKFSVCGHSMGGKIAMALGPMCPKRIESLIIIDALPKDIRNDEFYTKGAKPTFEKAKEFVNIPENISYEEFLHKLRNKLLLNNKQFAYLLESNLIKLNNNKPKWKCNMKIIYENIELLFSYEDVGQFAGKNVLIMRGEKSLKYDLRTFKHVFPNINEENFVEIKGAGHWVHAEKPRETKKTIVDFLKNIYQL